jgi:predicted GNAT superfamily acetyltransferase
MSNGDECAMNLTQGTQKVIHTLFCEGGYGLVVHRHNTSFFFVLQSVAPLARAV